MKSLSSNAYKFLTALMIVVLAISAMPVSPAYAAAITVNSLLDATSNVDGVCTLREAIINANNNAATWTNCAAGTAAADIISFSVSGTITLTANSALPNIGNNGPLTINGGGNITLRGNSDRIMRINQNAQVTLSNLTFTNGNGADGNDGGAIFNQGQLNISGSTFSANSTANGDGGAIFLEEGSLTISNSNFTNNSAFDGDGGAIFNNQRSLTISNTSFTGNSTNNGDGGAIFNDQANGTETLTNVTFTNNSANRGGAISSDQTTLNISGSTFTGNTTNGGNRLGGAIYQTNNGSLTITTTIFSNNIAGASGGAIYLADANAATITLSTFSGNSVNRTATNAATQGGAIYNATTPLTIGNSTFANNTVTTYAGNSQVVQGGAIYANANTTTVNVTFSGNSVSGGSGAKSGGNIYRNGGTFALRNTIVNNGAPNNCGGTIINTGTNIDSGATCAFGIANGSVSNTNPRLGALTGSPSYFPLNVDSPAIDTGNNAACAAVLIGNVAQNIVTRPRDGDGNGTNICDIGSFEFPGFIVVVITSDLPDPSVYGQAVTVNYTVTSTGGGTPTGTVTVTDGVNNCSGTVAAGTCSITLTTVGARPLTATYSGDVNFNTATSAGVSHQVNKANTTTTITSDLPDPSVYGQSVPVNFTVLANVPGSGTPTGNVTVSDGVNSCTATVAIGTCTIIAFTTVGTRTLTATYVGDTNFNGSISANELHVVNKANTTTSIVSDLNPSEYGQTVTFTATVVAVAPGTGTPSGIVTFTDGVTVLGTGNLNPSGVATFNLNTLTAGPHTITATYAGDINFNISNNSLLQTVTQKPLTVTADDRTKTYGDVVVFAGTEFTSSGLLPWDSITSVTLSSTGAPATATVAGSTYAIIPSLALGTGLSNYSITYLDGALTVNAADLLITASSDTMVYGGTVPTITPSYTGLQAGDTQPATTPTCSTTATNTSPVTGSPYTTSCSGAADTNYNISYATGTVTITTADLLITASSDTMVYGGIVPTITPIYTGLQAGDTQPATPPTCSTTATNTSPVTGSPYTTSCSGAADTNYNISYATGTVTITAADLLITASSDTMVYGGTVPTITPSYTGLQAGDTQPATPPTCSTTATNISPVSGNPYTTSCSGAADTNYNISYATGTVTITAADLLITASSDTMIYGGTVPVITPIYTGLQAGDTQPATPPTCSTTATSTSSVLGSPYTSSCSGAVDTNYSISYASGIVNITTKTASVTPDDASKTYGSADPAFTGTLTGFLPADNVTANYTRTAGETVLGSPYIISATLNPAGVLSNYSITYNTANFTIDPKTASVTPDAASKTYGSADPAFTGTLTGFLPADNVTAAYSRTAGETVAGNPYTISATLAPVGVLSNYTITYNTANFTIDQKTASVTPNAASKIYGNADPVLTGALTGFLPADNVTATYSRTAGETVAGNPYTISATLAPNAVLGNYNITYNTANFTIDQKTASVTPNSASKIYGSADPVLTGTLTGFLPADNVTATYSRTAGETVAGNPYTISGTLAPNGVLGNYNITYNTANFTIAQKTASVTPNSASKIYGSADPVLTGTLTGFLPADNVTATYSRTAGETVAGNPYIISAILAPSGVLGNYNITYNTANFTITQKTASVTPNAASKIYGSADPAFTGTLTGFLPADNVTATYSRTAGETVAGSPYTISATLAPNGVLGNYAITYNTANFTINQKAASVTPNVANKIFGDPDPVLSGTLSGFLPADNVTATYSRVAGETVAGSPYAISAALAPVGVLGNYNITYNTANFIISQFAATVSISNLSHIYDGTQKPASYSTNPPGLTTTVTYTGTNGTVYPASATPPTKTGSYTVNVSITDSNYSGSATDTLIIAPATIDPSIAADNKVYNGSTSANIASRSLTGVFGIDDVSLTGGIANFADPNIGIWTVTATGLSLTGADAGNYQLSSTSAATTAEITKRTLTVTATGVNKVYDGNTNATVTLSDDRVAGDDVTTGYASASFADPNVNTGIAISVSGISITGGASAGNYTLGNNTANTSANITINGQAITVTQHAPAASSNGSTFDVSATASSGLPVSITTAGACTGSGTSIATITMISGIGTCNIYYDQAGDINYSAASQVQEDVTAQEGPAFTSVSQTTFEVSLLGNFSITATGNPISPMTISLSGTLPVGVTFTDNGDGTASLSGTPANGTNGVYNFVLTANNGVAPNGLQDFKLIVKNGPVVDIVNSTPDTGDGKVSENESIIDTLGITKLTVEFSQDVYDDPTDVLDYGHDATNPANYILVRSATGTFATVDCAGGVVAPDINISVDSVSYSNGGGTGPFVSTLSINGGLPLNVVGFYRLYVCGTTSIVDANNRNLELAGNGTTPGTDYLRNFRIATAIVNGGNGNASSSSKKTLVTNGFLIPVTGFAPNQVTNLPAQPADKVYTSMGQMTIEIPTLGVKFPIVGASIANKTWDLTWLKDSVAYLEGSAYPTTAGNTVLTAHVQDANKNLGPFSDIKGMELGQKIYIHVNGQVYVYQVQENSKISSNNIEAMFKHEEDSWITLVTCEDYNAKTGVYSNRRMVRAVLISVVPER